jgi:predicted acetyltransferase
MEQLELVYPSLELASAYEECAAEFRQAGETFLSIAANYPEFVRRCEGYRRGRYGFVPQMDFFLLRDGVTILGRSALRTQLTPALHTKGGHIGYRIRPLERRKGYGTRILALTLAEAPKHGLQRVLLTCDSDNTGSRKVIEQNGGELAEEAIYAQTGVQIASYWIQLPTL